MITLIKDIVLFLMVTLLCHACIKLWLRAEYAEAAFNVSRAHLEALNRTRTGAVDMAYTCKKK